MGNLSVNFNRSEFSCKCRCGYETVDVELLTILETIRQHFDASIKVTSGARCSSRNKQEGGAKNSQHLIGRAADIQVNGVEPKQVADFVDKTWPETYGLGRYSVFTHVDSRDHKARWGSN